MTWHKFIYVYSVQGWSEIGNDIHWNVVFVDHIPVEQRVIDIERLQPHTDIFVVHDTNHLTYGYESLLSTFKYKFVYKRYDPEATVVSDLLM